MILGSCPVSAEGLIYALSYSPALHINVRLLFGESVVHEFDETASFTHF